MREHAIHDGSPPGRRALAGLAGGLLGSLAMNLFGRAVVRARGGTEADGAAPGIDRAGRGVQPPQARGTADDDATVRAGSIAYESVTGEPPRSREARQWLGSAAHYAFGGAAGLTYGLLADGAPALRAGYGLVYGALVWALADEMAMPALGLSRGPRTLSRGVLAYALAGHIVYGAALEAVMRSLAGRPHEGADASARI